MQELFQIDGESIFVIHWQDLAVHEFSRTNEMFISKKLISHLQLQVSTLDT